MGRFYRGQPVRCVKGWVSVPPQVLAPRVGEHYVVEGFCPWDDAYISVSGIPLIQRHPFGFRGMVWWEDIHFAPVTDELVRELLETAAPVRLREPEDA